MNAAAPRGAGWLGAVWQARRTVGLLDIGSSKIACLIIAPGRPSTAERGARRPRVLGAGVAASRGLIDGRVVALDAAEQAVRAAVAEAERTAGASLKEVVIAISGADLNSQRFTAHTRLGGGVVDGADLARMMAGARSYAERDGRTLLHAACHGYRLDDATGITDPEGLAGQLLAADLCVVTADAAQLSNLLHVVERAYLRPARVAPAPCASALAATSEAERRRGVIAADMGAGGTTLALFAEGRLAWLGCVPLGGDHITRGIAQELGVSGRDAERIKRDCGTLSTGAADGDEIVLPAEPSRNASSTCSVSRERVRELVRERLRDLCSRIVAAVAQSGVGALPCAVLSGGASQQPGLPELAGPLLGIAVRQARIEHLPGMPEAFVNPAFATTVGLAHVALDPTVAMRADRSPARGGGYLTRVGQWLAESF